jgi:hypothetical protein
MHYSALALSLFLLAAPAQAQTAGQTCTNFGQETMAADGTDLVVCLYNSESDHSLIWKASTGGGNSGGGYIVQQNTNDCYYPNSLLTPPACDCPSGYTAAPTAVGAPPCGTCSGDGYVGYTCFQSSSAPQAGANSGVWEATSNSALSCASSAQVGNNPTGQACDPTGSTTVVEVLTEPCQPGSGYTCNGDDSCTDDYSSVTGVPVTIQGYNCVAPPNPAQ